MRVNKNRLFKLAVSSMLVLALSVSPGFLTFAEDAETADQSDTPPYIVQEAQYVASGESYDFTDQESKNALLEEGESMPVAFDLRNVDTDSDGEGDTSYVTHVKLQNPFGSCWAFAAISAAETSLIGAGLADLSIDLSERHLGIFAFSTVLDENNPQYGEGYLYPSDSGAERLGIGGNPFLASSVLASGAGPVLENDDPQLIYRGIYGNIDQRVVDGKNIDFSYSSSDDWSIDEAYHYKKSFSLRESYMLPFPAGVDPEDLSYRYNEAATVAIKKQLLEHRAVEIGFLADQASPGDEDLQPIMLSDDWAQYGEYTNMANHAVTIVGWDDTIGSEDSPVQFKESSKPEKPGAWLVKNSWGSGEEAFPDKGTGKWGIVSEETGNHTGYFWLSYYDHSISTPEALVFEEDKGYSLLAHDYMPASEICATESEDEVKMANLFESDINGYLRQISFYTTHPNTSVSYDIYLNPSEVGRPDLGKLVASGDCGVFEFGGFHKADLEATIPLMHGQNFSIVITEKTSDGQYSVNIPRAAASSFKGVINPGESTLFRDGEWLDLSDSSVQESLNRPDDSGERSGVCDNFSIKAFIEPLDTEDGTESICFNASLSGTKSVYFTPQGKTASLRLRFTRYMGYLLPENLKAKWTLDNNIYDFGTKIGEGQLVELSGLDEDGCGMSAKISVRKDGDKYMEGQTYLTIDLYDADHDDAHIGTIVASVSAARMSVEGVDLADRKPGDDLQASYVYDGKAKEPELKVTDFKGNTLVPGTDYISSYSNNVNCGLACATVQIIGDYVHDTMSCGFAITPAKAVLKSVTPGKSKLTLKVKNQSKSGITGYQVRYRQKGTSKWTYKKIKTTSGKLTVKGLTKGKKYEVQVRGYVNIPNYSDYWGLKANYYGEYSNLMTSAKIK